MKYKILFIMLINLIIIFPFKTVMAGIDYSNGVVCDDLVDLDDGNVSKKCKINLNVVNGKTYYNKINVKLTLTNLIIHEINVNKGWTLTRDSDNNLYFSSYLPSFEIGRYEIGTMVLYKVKKAELCSLEYEYVPSIINRSCTVENNYYYDHNGELISELEYEKECLPHSCEILSDGTKFGKDGNKVDDLTYSKECLTHKCEILSDGTKYGKDGNKVDDLTYSKECLTHKCEILSDGTKYGKDGNKVDDLTYSKECLTHSCEILSDGTKFGKDGKIVDDLTYSKECLPHSCEILSDGTIFGKDGDIVNRLVYEKECQENKCVVLSDGTIYGASGSIVNKLTYEKECLIHNCEVLSDGTKYNKNGLIVDDATYRNECLPKCQKIGDIFYDDKGNEVNEEEYNKICNVITNPDTGGISWPFILFILGYEVLKRHNKINKI